MAHETAKQLASSTFGGRAAGADPDGAPRRLLNAPSSPRADRLKSQADCGYGAVIGTSPDNCHVVIIPLLCKSWDCPYCGPRKRWLWINRLREGAPTREMTLTCPANKFPSSVSAAIAMKKAFSILVKRIRKKYGTFEYALVWELTHKGTPHCHILFKGCYIPKAWLSKTWSKLGIGYIVHLQKIQGAHLHAAHACKYLAKANGQSAKALAPLRIIQLSKQYLPPETPEDTQARYPDYSWYWSPQDPDELVEEYCACNRTFDVTHNKDGTVEIHLIPLPNAPPVAHPYLGQALHPDVNTMPIINRIAHGGPDELSTDDWKTLRNFLRY